MKILIIGAKGMLGTQLVRVFSKDNEVVAWDREEIDITKNAECRMQILELKPGLLINAAAYNDVDGAEKKPDTANAINGHAVGQLAAVAANLDIPIVHFTTDYVFDGEKQQGYFESDKPNPISTYAQSKLLGEQELQKNTDKFYLIRLSRLFGSSPLSPLPDGEGNQRKKSFVSLMLELAKAKKEIEVVDEELSSPTYAPDLAERTKYIFENKLPFGIYHATNSGACTWYGLAREIFKIVGIDVKLVPVPASLFARPAKRPKYSILLNTKLPQMRSWQEALKEYLGFTKY
ncbi:MAG: dTDP-4-dehydrorhamnose reductase [bacterium]|nr:dTDP-4-dehydrorhamnose reductase [bacterium]